MAALYNGHRDLANEIADAQIAAGEPLDVLPPLPSGAATSWTPRSPRPERWPAYSYDGWTALHLAAFFGQLEAAARLLEAGGRLAAVSRNPLANTPLHAAVAGGQPDVSVFLIARGADVNATDSGRHTPLHIAAETVSFRSWRRSCRGAPIRTPSTPRTRRRCRAPRRAITRRWWMR